VSPCSRLDDGIRSAPIEARSHRDAARDIEVRGVLERVAERVVSALQLRRDRALTVGAARFGQRPAGPPPTVRRRDEGGVGKPGDGRRWPPCNRRAALHGAPSRAAERERDENLIMCLTDPLYIIALSVRPARFLPSSTQLDSARSDRALNRTPASDCGSGGS